MKNQEKKQKGGNQVCKTFVIILLIGVVALWMWICGNIDAVDFFTSVVGELTEGGIKSAMRFSDSDVVGIVCSRASRYNESSSFQELSSLVDRLMQCEMPYCDVRGRPTMIQFSRGELERRFNAAPAK